MRRRKSEGERGYQLGLPPSSQLLAYNEASTQYILEANVGRVVSLLVGQWICPSEDVHKKVSEQTRREVRGEGKAPTAPAFAGVIFNTNWWCK